MNSDTKNIIILTTLVIVSLLVVINELNSIVLLHQLVEVLVSITKSNI